MGGCNYLPGTDRSPPGGHMAMVIREVRSIISVLSPKSNRFRQYSRRADRVNYKFQGFGYQEHVRIPIS